jgi:hypothetical protein
MTLSVIRLFKLTGALSRIRGLIDPAAFGSFVELL